MSLTLTQRSTAAKVYRAVRRAQKELCEGDRQAERATSYAMKSYFNSFLHPSTSTPTGTSRRRREPPSFEDGIKGALQIKDYFEKNVVKGILNEKGVYELKFTEKTEMGYNDDIKKKNKSVDFGDGSVKCCSA